MLKQELQLKQALSPQQVIEATLLQLNNSNLEKNHFGGIGKKSNPRTR